jgi:hypothetical protein
VLAEELRGRGDGPVWVRQRRIDVSAGVLAEIGPAAKAALPALEKALYEEDGKTNQAVRRAILKLGGKIPDRPKPVTPTLTG